MVIKSQYLNGIQPYLAKILDVFNDGIYITDSAGKTLKVNKMYEMQSGLKEEELLGKPVTDLIKEGVFDVALNPEIVRTGKPQTCVQINKKGRKIILNGNPVFDENGDVVFVVTFARDITVLSQLKDQLAAQQELIDKYHQKLSYYEKSKTFSPIAKSSKMLNLLTLLKKVAKTDATVLLLGETGVGKDVLAHMIHENSLRYNEQFFKVDCASIPENLIESELFGYTAGAFSGANTKGKTGFFELADKGTLFLDEIGELPLSMQTKLLRVLQDQEVVRVGSTKVKRVDVRFIAATNKNLEQAVREGKFRSDLYYRLRVAVIDIPPLRERIDDILPLADHFFKKYLSKYKKEMNYNQDVKAAFKSYHWPGNVRELENVIEHLFVMSNSEKIGLEFFPSYMKKEQVEKETEAICVNKIIPFKEAKKILETQLIQMALNKAGSLRKAAKLLQVDHSTLIKKNKR